MCNLAKLKDTMLQDIRCQNSLKIHPKLIEGLTKAQRKRTLGAPPLNNPKSAHTVPAPINGLPTIQKIIFLEEVRQLN